MFLQHCFFEVAKFTAQTLGQPFLSTAKAYSFYLLSFKDPVKKNKNPCYCSLKSNNMCKIVTNSTLEGDLFLVCANTGFNQGTLVCRCAGVATPAKPVWDFEKKKKKKKKHRVKTIVFFFFFFFTNLGKSDRSFFFFFFFTIVKEKKNDRFFFPILCR